MAGACSIDECTRPVVVSARRLCSLHYVRWQQTRKPFTELLVHRDAGNRIERFWAKVDKNGGPDSCWPWLAARGRGGYGVFNTGRAAAGKAHRFAYELAHSVMLPKGATVMHTCDNPPCVNPAHLILGTPATNSQDMSRKGRSVHGERNSHARLTETDVRDMRRRHARGEASTALATQFGVTFTQVRNIILRRQWKHVL